MVVKHGRSMVQPIFNQQVLLPLVLAIIVALHLINLEIFGIVLLIHNDNLGNNINQPTFWISTDGGDTYSVVYCTVPAHQEALFMIILNFALVEMAWVIMVSTLWLIISMEYDVLSLLLDLFQLLGLGTLGLLLLYY